MSFDTVFEPTVETQIVTVKQVFKDDTTFDGVTNSFTQYPKISLNTYVNPTDQYEFTPKKYIDDTFLTQINATNTYLTQNNATSTYLPLTTASSTYLSQANASSTYLSQADASSTYLTQASASSTYLPTATASSTYLSQADATNTYLTQASASSTYLPSATASSTYLSQADATSTYLTQASASSTYLPTATASSTYLTQADATTALALKATESFVTTSINTAINNLINSAPTTLDTLGEIATILQSNVNDIGTLTTSIAGKVSKTANETISGILTFSQAPVMSGASISSGTIPDSALVSTFLKTSDASTTYLTQSNASTTYQTQSATTTLLELKANLNSAALTGTPTAPTPNVINNTTQIATTAYVKTNLSSYQPNLSGSSNITVGTLACSTLTPSSLITSTIFCENIISVTPSSNVYTLDFASGNVFYSNGNPSANFTCNITNIPTSSNSQQFTITLITNIGTYYCSSASAVKTNLAGIVSASAPKYSAGIAPTVGTSAIVIHTLTIIQCFATKYIIYGASPFN